jgi:aminopeptidase N
MPLLRTILLAVSLALTAGARAEGRRPNPPASGDLPVTRDLPSHLDMTRDLDRFRFEPKRGELPPIEPASRSFDVDHYDIGLVLDLPTTSVGGRVVVDGHATMNGLRTVTLHAGTALVIDGVASEGAPLDHVRIDDRLLISLPSALAEGEPFTIEVDYHGPGNLYPGYGLVFGSHDGAPIIWTNDEPIGARLWLPCHDVPIDKATTSMAVTVDAGLIVSSNGVLTGVDDGGDTKTWRFEESHPIATYLIVVSASNFETIDDEWTHDGRTVMPIRHYVWPESYDAALEDFNITPAALDFLSGRFGLYPFADESYGMTEIPWAGAMENQTLTSYSSDFIRGDHLFDNILVHELSHQWFGDHVTPAIWQEIWVNEGFATYCEALWFEELYGTDILYYVMDLFRWVYFAFHGEPHHAIWGPPEGHLFCVGEYYKASCVLHMLRREMGDDAFFTALRNYVDAHAAGNVTTTLFRQACEAEHGEDLSWFFRQWVTGPGFPIFEYGFSNDAPIRPRDFEARTTAATVSVQIDQVQEWDVFSVPMDIRVFTAAGVTDTTVRLERRSHRFAIHAPAPADSVRLDPNSWIFGEYFGPASRIVSVPESPASFRLQASPNPFAGSLAIRVPAVSGGPLELRIFDARGRLVRDLGPVGGGARADDAGRVTWDGRDRGGNRVPAGLYFMRLEGPAGEWTGRVLRVR